MSFDQPPGPSNLYLLTADYGYSGRVSVGVRDAADQQADAIQHFTITGSPTVADLGLTASLSQASVTAGGSLTVSASATGGTPPYTYAFDWLVLDGDQVSAVGSYEGPQGSHSQALRFGQQGAVSVSVVDALGRGKEIDPLPFTITGSVAAAPLSLLASLDDTSADPGQTLALSVTALGGLAPYQYSYQWVVDDLGQEYVLSQAGGDQTSYSQRVPFGQSGYALAVVTDSLGRQAAARAGFIVNTAAPLTPLAVHFSFQSATLPPGGTLRLLAEPSGGQPPYSYSLALFIDTPEGLALADLRTTESRETAWTISEGSGGLVLASLSDSLGRATPEQSLRFTVKAGILPGDADLDGRVTVDDAARVLDFILRDIAPASMENANADGLGAVDLQDLLTIIQMAVGGRAGAGRFSRARARWP